MSKHSKRAGSGVTGRPDELRGEVIAAFVVLRQGHQPSEDLQKELLGTVRSELDPVVFISEINFVGTLPKTRNGKIKRRVLRAFTLDREPGDASTIEDGGSVEEARLARRQLKTEMSL
jgi:acetyl-CoA synthetase